MTMRMSIGMKIGMRRGTRITMRVKVRMRTRLEQNENEGKNDDEMKMRTKKTMGMRLEMSIQKDELRNTECKMEKFQDNKTDLIGVIKFA